MAFAPLHTKRLKLRALAPGDLDAVFAILGHKQTTVDVSWGLDTRKQSRQWLERRYTNESEHGFSMWAVELLKAPDMGTPIIGLCGFFPTDVADRIELGYVIHADHWGRGYGSEAARSAVEAATSAGLNIVATIRTTNDRSLRVARRIGLVQTGEIHDQRGTLLVWNLEAAVSSQTSTEEEALAGGWQTEVHRSGQSVLRSPGPQSKTIIRLLAHLDNEGFDAAPKPIGNGFADDGREHLSFIEGASPQPLAWGNDATWDIGNLLRRLHRSTSNFDPGPDPRWQPWFARDLPGAAPVIGHGDLGPWNIIARDALPVAFIDWDNAGPVDATWELAQVTWLNAQLHDDDVAVLNHLPSPAERFGQARLILDGYGLPITERAGFVDKMIEFAIFSARDEAVMHAVTPETESPTPSGFPTLWSLTWRTRAAAWMIEHREALTRALTR